MIEQFILSMFSIFVLIFFLCTVSTQKEVEREYYLYRNSKINPVTVERNDEDE